MSSETISSGTTSGIYIGSGFTLTMVGPATLTSSEVGTSGTLILENGALGENLTLNGGYGVISLTDGSQILDADVSTGTLLVDDSTDRDAQVYEYGRVTLQNSAVSYFDTIQGGGELVQLQATACSSLIMEGQHSVLTAENGGTALLASNDGGLLQALTTGTILNETNISGIEGIYGGFEQGGTNESQGTLFVGMSGRFLYNGLARDDTNYGLQSIASTGTIANDTIDSGGTTQIQGIADNLLINSGGMAEIYSGGTASGTINLSGSLILDSGSVNDAALIFGSTGTLGFKGISDVAGSSSFVGISNNVATFDLNGTFVNETLVGDYTNSSFNVESVLISGESSTEITIVEGVAPCFVRGTGILTSEGYVPVEKLEIGYKVITADNREVPIKWIGTHSHDGRFIEGNHLMLPVCFKPGSLGDGVPEKDLYVSPGHAMRIGDALVPAWRLIDGVGVTQAQKIDSVHYYHIELPEHDIIMAEGAWVETYLEQDNRGQFQNAASYKVLYPEADTPKEPCLPRLEDGARLEVIRHLIAARSGVTLPKEDFANPGSLKGFIDQKWAPDLLVGWAQDTSNPEAPVHLDVIVDGKKHLVVANSFRPDLRKALGTSGIHGFMLKLDPALVNPVIEVRRNSDQRLLALTPEGDRDWNSSAQNAVVRQASSLSTVGSAAGPNNAIRVLTRFSSEALKIA